MFEVRYCNDHNNPVKLKSIPEVMHYIKENENDGVFVVEGLSRYSWDSNCQKVALFVKYGSNIFKLGNKVDDVPMMEKLVELTVAEA